MKDYKKYYIIPALPEEVYLALTLPATIQLWTGEEAEMSTEPGSEFSLMEGSIVGKNIAFEEGKKIRNSERFKDKGTNVNFIEKELNELFVRTYERGVEGETFSCGTGVTAAALVASLRNVSTATDFCDIKTLGGNLKAKFQKHSDNTFTDIWLEGAATFVFKGEIEL